ILDDYNHDFGGLTVAPAGDVNGDGIADIMVGAALGNDAYVVMGGDELAGLDAADGASDGIARLSNLDGENGFRVALAGHFGFGIPLHGVGDVNGDGFDDVMVWHPYGGGVLLFGSDAGFQATYHGQALNALDGTVGYRFAEPTLIGSVSSAGDID